MIGLMEFLIETLITGSIITLIFLTVSILTKKLFQGKWHYRALKVCLLLFIIPIMDICKYILSYKPIEVQSVNLPQTTNAINSSIQTIPENIKKVFFILWGSGIAMYLLWNICCYIKFINELKLSKVEDREWINQLTACKNELRIKHNISILKSDFINVPMLIGILKPSVVIPSSMIYDESLKPVMIHELIHFKRKDLLLKGIQVIVTSINWFNPIIYILNKNIDVWCEISCDEFVVEDMVYVDRKKYGQTIIRILEDSITEDKNLCVCLCSNQKNIKRRLEMMLKSRERSYFEKLLSGLLVFSVYVIGVGLATETVDMLELKQRLGYIVSGDMEGLLNVDEASNTEEEQLEKSNLEDGKDESQLPNEDSKTKAGVNILPEDIKGVLGNDYIINNLSDEVTVSMLK